MTTQKKQVQSRAIVRSMPERLYSIDSPTAAPTLAALRMSVAAAQFRNCGSEHEVVIAEQLPRCVSFQMKRAGLTPNENQYLCADRGCIANCAHRNAGFNPDPFLREITALCNQNVLDHSWLQHAQNLASLMTAYDYQVNWGLDGQNAPTPEARQAHQLPLIAQIKDLQSALLHAIDDYESRGTGVPIVCTLPAATLTAAPWQEKNQKPKQSAFVQTCHEFRNRLGKLLSQFGISR